MRSVKLLLFLSFVALSQAKVTVSLFLDHFGPFLFDFFTFSILKSNSFTNIKTIKVFFKVIFGVILFAILEVV